MKALIISDIHSNIYALEAIWEREWEEHLVATALERLKQQVSAAQYQIFHLHVIKQYKPEEVARAAKVKVDNVYLVKHRLGKQFKNIITELEKETA